MNRITNTLKVGLSDRVYEFDRKFTLSIKAGSSTQIFGQFYKKTHRTNVNLVMPISVEDVSCVKNILHPVEKTAIENESSSLFKFIHFW
jgi:hypothetical protein